GRRLVRRETRLSPQERPDCQAARRPDGRDACRGDDAALREPGAAEVLARCAERRRLARLEHVGHAGKERGVVPYSRDRGPTREDAMALDPTARDPMHAIAAAEAEIEQRRMSRQRMQVESRHLVALEQLTDEVLRLRAEVTTLRGLFAASAGRRR